MLGSLSSLRTSLPMLAVKKTFNSEKAKIVSVKFLFMPKNYRENFTIGNNDSMAESLKALISQTLRSPSPYVFEVWKSNSFDLCSRCHLEQNY